ncbi:hypothetical protein ES703_85685 [subsurface metagenome]
MLPSAANNNIKRKVVNNFVEFWNDTLYIRGKPPANRRLRRYLKAKTGSKVWQIISTSPTDIQFFTHYTDTPIESRRKMLDNDFSKLMPILYDVFPRLFYLSLWSMSEGISLIEIKDVLKEYFGHELSEVMVEEMTRQLGTSGVLKFDMSSLGFGPANIAGANARLKSILNQRSMKHGDHKSDYEQDLSVALWECSEGAHLDEFRKMFSDKGDLAEEATSLWQMLKEKDFKAIRSIFLRILRKTIEDLPDIRQDIRNLEAQGREVPLTDEMRSTLEARPDQYENALDNFLDMLAEHSVDINRLDTRELDLLSDELNRLGYGMTRKEYYGDRENQRKQQLKYLAKRFRS